MNRIRELREAAGMSQADLATKAGMSEAQLSRLETGVRRLNMDAMKHIAEALECAPEDLIAYTASLPINDDVEAAEFEGMPGISEAIASGGMRIYKVKSDAVSDAGISAGMTIVVKETSEAAMAAKTGDIVLAMIGGTTVRVLRQYIEPATLITNRRRNNSLARIDDKSSRLRIIGVVARVATS